VVQRCRELLRRQRGLPTEGATPAADALPGEESGQASDRSLAIHRIRTEQALEAALQNDEFQLHFQPIVRLADRAVAGYEALLRWHKPGQGLVPPGEFIGIAEASTFIHRLGRWILSAAVDGLLALDARLPARSEPLFMTVNLSARQLEDPELLDTITREAGRLVGRYCQLKLEITESLMIGNVAEVQKFIGHCRGAGVPVVLDDFGTGFCSLSYLHLFDVHTMKLDRSFVRGMTVSLASEKVVRGVTRMAHDLGLVVVAEGIEREDEAAQASAIGINYAQGYLFGRPQPLTKILAARS
jgi:EAL domain-containing protein (putative c-di-GMP-specific phosphodiesterase class I)